jgi:hypothetical protein
VFFFSFKRQTSTCVQPTCICIYCVIGEYSHSRSLFSYSHPRGESNRFRIEWFQLPNLQNCVLQLISNENGMIYLYKLLNLCYIVQKQEHTHNTVHPNATAIYLVITSPCTAGDFTFGATPNKSHDGIRS